MLRLAAIGGLSLAPAPSYAAAGADAAEQLDHFALGVSDLDKGLGYLEAKLGVQFTIRSHHPGQGTRMAGVSLGDKRFLELLAPDPGQPGVENPFLSTVREFSTPTVLGWAAATRDIEALAVRLRTGGYGFENGETLIEPRDGDRWTLCWIQVHGYAGGVVPWMVQPDPHSEGEFDLRPSGCQLLELNLEHPDATKINDLFTVLELGARVTQASEGKVGALLGTPNGEIELGG